MRLFVAVNFPEAERARLGSVLEDLAQTRLPIRWVTPDSLHITLKFLGEVADAQVEGIVPALGRVARSVPSFDVALGGFGAFPTLQRPRILWLGVQAPDQLRDLQERVEDEFTPLGFPREERPFHAHVTLGRLKNAAEVDSAQLDRILSTVGYRSAVEVGSIDLMRSHTGAGGARYERVACAMLEKQ